MNTESKSEDEDGDAMLNMLTEKVMPQAIKSNLVAYCPTMDLLALVTVNEQMHVFRLNGQRVFGVSSKKDKCKIIQLQWKPNGRVLAIAFDNSTISLINSHTGKAIHKIDVKSQTTWEACCLGWGISFLDAHTTRRQLDKLDGASTLDDILQKGLQNVLPDGLLDLPSELAFLDIEGILPKLSVLPVGGRDDEIFSSRASIDAVFHSSRKDSNDSVDVLLMGSSDNVLHLSIYDFFEIGDFKTEDIFASKSTYKLVQHCSHPYSSTHGLLFTQSLLARTRIFLVPLDLKLIHDTGRYLALIASKSTQLQNILRYIQSTQIHIYNEFNLSQDLPSKFIRNIEEALQEKNQCSFVTAAYHLVATGDCYPVVKEWLVDELSDRGQKRWDKATTAGYENLRRLTHENLLPALERFSVLISRLWGLSRFHELNTALGLVTVELDQILDTLHTLQFLAHNVLIYAGSELRQFTAFSLWLRHEIENQATDPLSLGVDDTTEKDTPLDYQQILDYIQGAMQQSTLFELFGLQASQDERLRWDIRENSDPIYDRYKSEVKQIRQGAKPETKLPGLAALIERLNRQCKIVFTRIAETQKRKVRFGDVISLCEISSSCYDARMTVHDVSADSHEIIYYFATAERNPSCSVRVHKVRLAVLNGISSLRSIEHAAVLLPREQEIKDIKYVDDQIMIVALAKKSSSCLAYFPYRDDNGAVEGLEYGSSQDGSSLDLSDEVKLKHYIRHTFPAGNIWTPQRLEVNGRKGRRAVCVISEDNLHFRIFDLDSSREVDGGEDEDDIEEDDGSYMIT